MSTLLTLSYHVEPRLWHQPSPSGTIPAGDTMFGYSISSSGDRETSTTPPLSPPHPKQPRRKLPVGAMLSKPAQSSLARRAKTTSVSGGEMKRHVLGSLGGTTEVSTAFGLRPDVLRGSSSGDPPSREKRRGFFVGRRRVGSDPSHLESGVGAGDDYCTSGAGGSGTYPLQGGGQRRQDGSGAATAMVLDPYGSGSLDDLDPFMGLQGMFDFNFAESTDLFPGLSASLRLPETGAGNHVAGNKHAPKNNEVSISGSSDDDDDDGDDVVVSPIIVDELNETVRRQKKSRRPT